MASALVLAMTTLAGADEAPPPPPVWAGPVVLGPATAAFADAAYAVSFGEGGRTAQVVFSATLSGASEVTLGFAGRGAGAVRVRVDGQPVEAVPSASPLPLAGGPFDTQVVFPVPLVAGAPRTLEVEVRCDTRSEERDPQLNFPQATFLLNRRVEGPTAWVVRLDPAAAADADLRLRARTSDPLRPEAPVAGDAVAAEGGWVVEGPVVIDPATPLEAVALDGEYGEPRNWSVAFGMGLALDWVWQRQAVENAAGAVVEKWYETPVDPASRIWFRLFFEYAFEKWLVSTGFEGDLGGALEIPLLFTYFPMEGHPEPWAWFSDWRLTVGASFQVFNDKVEDEYAFDPRAFLRVGAGVRLFMLTLEAAYELGLPAGDWDGPHGGLEHKFLFLIPWAF